MPKSLSQSCRDNDNGQNMVHTPSVEDKLDLECKAKSYVKIICIVDIGKYAHLSLNCTSPQKFHPHTNAVVSASPNEIPHDSGNETRRCRQKFSFREEPRRNKRLEK